MLISLIATTKSVVIWKVFATVFRGVLIQLVSCRRILSQKDRRNFSFSSSIERQSFRLINARDVQILSEIRELL